jgi:hypothetical protein
MNEGISPNIIVAITVAVAAYLQEEQAAVNSHPDPVKDDTTK